MSPGGEAAVQRRRNGERERKRETKETFTSRKIGLKTRNHRRSEKSSISHAPNTHRKLDALRKVGNYTTFTEICNFSYDRVIYLTIITLHLYLACGIVKLL